MTMQLVDPIAPYRRWPVILDSNLLLLQVCASLDVSLLKTFKRLDLFDLGDVGLLAYTLSQLGPQTTTPHVLTEVSNLSNSLPSWRKLAWADHLLTHVTRVVEISEPTSKILADRSLAVFGITDAALGSLARDHLILSVDWPLCNMLTSRGMAALNFRYLRQ